MERTKTIELISVVAIAMALTIVFSGVALASPPVVPTKETEILEITTDITCSGTVVESQRLSLESEALEAKISKPEGEIEYVFDIYGKIGYDEKMIGLSGDTEFDKCFKVDTGTTPNLDVHKQIGYTSGFLGSLSHDEQVGMKIIADGITTTTTTTTYHICPFDNPDTKTTTIIAPSSCEEVNVYSEMVVTDVQATTETEVGIIKKEWGPVNLNYQIQAAGVGLVVAGVDVYVADGRGEDTLGSRLMYKEKSIGYGSVTFHKKIGYESILP